MDPAVSVHCGTTVILLLDTPHLISVRSILIEFFMQLYGSWIVTVASQINPKVLIEVVLIP